MSKVALAWRLGLRWERKGFNCMELAFRVRGYRAHASIKLCKVLNLAAGNPEHNVDFRMRCPGKLHSLQEAWPVLGVV